MLKEVAADCIPRYMQADGGYTREGRASFDSLYREYKRYDRDLQQVLKDTPDPKVRDALRKADEERHLVPCYVDGVRQFTLTYLVGLRDSLRSVHPGRPATPSARQ